MGAGAETRHDSKLLMWLRVFGKLKREGFWDEDMVADSGLLFEILLFASTGDQVRCPVFIVVPLAKLFREQHTVL